jgi:GTP-binding protein Era
MSDTRAGFVALIGAPNAGKSTLLNKLVGAKVSIVSRKVQTTRALIRGIAMQGQTQIVYVDTPGIFAPKRRLDRAMVDAAWSGASDADAIGFLLDARKGIDAEAQSILSALSDIRKPKAAILNKVDLIDKPTLFALAEAINKDIAFDTTFMVSALSGSGVKDLSAWFAGHMPAGPFLYPEDEVSDVPLRMLAAEIVREAIYDRLHQELPYQSTVETTKWETRKDGSVRIEQTIFVARESQRKIVLGKAGQTLKAIGQTARAEIAEAVEAPVHLFLHVKVDEGWTDDPARYREMGLELPKD